MPTAPLFYRPLVEAQIRATPVGETTIGAAADRQLSFAIATSPDGTQRQIVPGTKVAAELGASELAPAVERTLGGMMALTDGRAGAQLDRISLAVDAEGYVANRTLTTLGNHPDVLDTASPEQAAGVAANLRDQAVAELQTATATYAGGTLDVGPVMTQMLTKSWESGEPMAADDAAALGFHLGREAEKAVTPVAPDSSSPLHWIEESTAETLALWPGALTANVQKLGIETDLAQVDQIAAQWRQESVSEGANAAPNRALLTLLGAAGVDIGSAEHHARAQSLLQDLPLEEVPQSLAGGIVDHMQLSPERRDWIAGRISELDGSPGNVGGLLAELSDMPPVTPAPVDGSTLSPASTGSAPLTDTTPAPPLAQDAPTAPPDDAAAAAAPTAAAPLADAPPAAAAAPPADAAAAAAGPSPADVAAVAPDGAPAAAPVVATASVPVAGDTPMTLSISTTAPAADAPAVDAAVSAAIAAAAAAPQPIVPR